MFSFFNTKNHGFINRTTVMNKFLSLGGVFVAAALLSGCSDNELASVETSEMNAIGFHVVGSQAETKAIPTTPSNLKDTDFDVFAFTANGTAFMGKADTEFGHDGVNIKYKDGKWDYANESDRRYWPTEALDFYAFNPGTIDEGMKGHYMWEADGTSQKISYTCSDEYSKESSTPGKNYDVMYAIAKDKTKDNTNGGKVNLQFKHILSQVVLKAKTQYDNMTVTINGIKIKYFRMGGTFTLPGDATTDPVQSNWEFNTFQITNGIFTVGMDNSPFSVTGTTIADISGSKPMLFIPQPLTAWDRTQPISQVDINKEQSYLEISCKIQQSGSYLFGDATNFKKLYVPFGADWQPGKRYIYTLIFGGGYDADGNAILTPIEFVPEVKDWVEESGNVDL